MQVVKVIYFKTFPVNNVYWEKCGLEAEINTDDDVRQCLYDLKKQVENFHYESNKAAEKQIQVEETQPSLSKVASIIRDIGTVKEMTVLQSYTLIAKNDPDIQAAYNKKLKELK